MYKYAGRYFDTGMCMYMLAGMLILVCVCILLKVCLYAGRYVNTGMCMYILASVCICGQVCVYAGRCGYMPEGKVVYVLVCVCIR